VRQFDVYENPDVATRSFAPYLIVLSSHLIVGFDDAVVAPLVNDSEATVAGLELDVEIDGQRLVLVISDLVGTDGRKLKKKVGSLVAFEDDIRRALDRLFTGF
jgi:toxin CcdB